MQQYILRRFLLAIVTLIGVSLMVFAIIRMVPGDVVVTMAAESGNVRPEIIERMRRELGLDKSILEQYGIWVSRLVTLDLGTSIISNRPIGEELLQRIPITLELAILSTVLAVLLAIPLGVISATRQDTWLDYAGRLFAIGGLSAPDFWIATMLLLFMSLWLHWIPPLGYIRPTEDLGAHLVQFAFPAAILGVRLSATSMRMMRSTLLEVLREDYIRTAWAKGLRERAIIYRHALKNSMIPVVTILGQQLSRQLGGTVVIETIFGLPGVGRMTLDAITLRDYPVIQANVMFLAAVLVLMNLIVDLSYGFFDPRIRFN